MLNRKQTHPSDDAPAISPATDTPAAEAGVAELRPVDDFRVCPACLVVNGQDDVFCTGCGAKLPAAGPATTPAAAEQTAVAETKEEAPRTLEVTLLHPPIPARPEAPMPRSGPTRLRRPHWLALAVALVLILAAVWFAVLWRVEASHSHRLSGRLATATGELGSARKQIASTEAQLKATSTVSQKRKAVLLRAQAVLASVDPLLSSVDGLQKRTSDIQGGRDLFSSAADALISDTFTLANYLIQTDPAYIDTTYEGQLIDTANTDLATVRADQASLGGYDASYGAASTRFGRRADSFTQAVRNLQRQLQAVASK
jgi:hypothetical protein